MPTQGIQATASAAEERIRGTPRGGGHQDAVVRPVERLGRSGAEAKDAVEAVVSLLAPAAGAGAREADLVPHLAAREVISPLLEGLHVALHLG